MFSTILVANRSEIAVRVINGCRTLGIRSVSVYSDADVNAKHRHYADESIHIGAAAPSESYLNIERIIAAACEAGAQAIHPGYGFLSENPAFAEACRDAGIAFIGPSAASMRLMGNKVASRKAMADAGVPLTPGMQSASSDLDLYRTEAERIGYPVMIKAAAGGGGKGMRVVDEPKDLAGAVEAAQREALNAFGDSSVYMEKFIARPRHIEFQIMADQHGNVVHLFERECSIQRRHQKIIEETPSVALTESLRAEMGESAVAVARAANYVNAGTVEFLLDTDGSYYFLEMNTRLQVEHPITEMVTGIDLVAEQIRIAAGEELSPAVRQAHQRGHAIECRIYAEDGENGFLPATGTIALYSEPVGPGIRVDSGVEAGAEIGIDYDPIMAKLIVHAGSRDDAIGKMITALKEFHILGVQTSRRFMIDCLEHAEFRAGNTFTSFISDHMLTRPVVADEMIQAGAAAASLAALAAAHHARLSTGEGSNQPLTPWQTIGAWQIGSSISHEATS